MFKQLYPTPLDLCCIWLPDPTSHGTILQVAGSSCRATELYTPPEEASNFKTVAW